MTDTLPKMHTCKNCGFMSMQGNLFERVGDDMLCATCITLYTKLFYFEADQDIGLMRGRSLHHAHESLIRKIWQENVTVFREATEADIVRVQTESRRFP